MLLQCAWRVNTERRVAGLRYSRSLSRCSANVGKVRAHGEKFETQKEGKPVNLFAIVS
jgi:hypothetical protein